jgi:hypothetical protein
MLRKKVEPKRQQVAEIYRKLPNIALHNMNSSNTSNVLSVLLNQGG